MGSNGIEEHSWSVDPGDAQGVAVITALGRQMRAWREALGMRVAELATLIGYGEDLIYKVEGGKRIAKPEYLDRVDEALKAGGLIKAMKEDLVGVRYPKEVRAIWKMEGRAIEVCHYSTHNIAGLLQTEAHMRALFEGRQPSYTAEEVGQGVAGRMARRSIFERVPAPAITVVQEEASLRRRIGGTMVWRQQLERILEVSELRSVTVQVMPMDCEVHAGMSGSIELLKFADGTGVGRSEGAFYGQTVSSRKQLQVLEMQYGRIRSQALTPGDSRVVIEKLLGET
ncbi:helix-turn-helix domain-containing protein [Streptomyces sp. NPDC059564]|uniref:helix-turn-helix domain-containing protein n=1 Tax=Streptomyces sp. NPDC059564 TaxID=3346865 RepID=UPI0036B66A38